MTRHVPIDALRASVTLLVVAHHAALAYHPFAPPPPDAAARCRPLPARCRPCDCVARTWPPGAPAVPFVQDRGAWFVRRSGAWSS